MTLAHFSQTSPADTCKNMLANMAATVFKHQLVSFFFHWLLLTAAKHELAFNQSWHGLEQVSGTLRACQISQ